MKIRFIHPLLKHILSDDNDLFTLTYSESTPPPETKLHSKTPKRPDAMVQVYNQGNPDFSIGFIQKQKSSKDLRYVPSYLFRKSRY